ESFIDQVYVYELAVTTSAIPRAWASFHAPVTWLEDGPTRTALKVDAPGPESLRLADEIYPGWHAYVDGIESGIQPDGIFRKVQIPKGSHTVRFEFKPASFRTGLFL